MTNGKQQEKLTYCLKCKRDTATVVYSVTIFLFIKSDKRICKACGNLKARTEVEQEWVEQ